MRPECWPGHDDTLTMVARTVDGQNLARVQGQRWCHVRRQAAPPGLPKFNIAVPAVARSNPPSNGQNLARADPCRFLDINIERGGSRGASRACVYLGQCVAARMHTLRSCKILSTNRWLCAPRAVGGQDFVCAQLLSKSAVAPPAVRLSQFPTLPFPSDEVGQDDAH